MVLSVSSSGTVLINTLRESATEETTGCKACGRPRTGASPYCGTHRSMIADIERHAFIGGFTERRALDMVDKRIWHR